MKQYGLESDAAQSPSEHSFDDHDESGSGDESHLRNYARGNHPHPPVFKKFVTEWQSLMGELVIVTLNYGLKASKEASSDRGWNDNQRAQRFSWLITGPAKTT